MDQTGVMAEADAAEMRRLAATAGFAVIAQPAVPWCLPAEAPGVVPGAYL